MKTGRLYLQMIVVEYAFTDLYLTSRVHEIPINWNKVLVNDELDFLRPLK